MQHLEFRVNKDESVFRTCRLFWIKVLLSVLISIISLISISSVLLVPHQSYQYGSTSFAEPSSVSSAARRRLRQRWWARSTWAKLKLKMNDYLTFLSWIRIVLVLCREWVVFPYVKNMKPVEFLPHSWPLPLSFLNSESYSNCHARSSFCSVFKRNPQQNDPSPSLSAHFPLVFPLSTPFGLFSCLNHVTVL